MTRAARADPVKDHVYYVDDRRRVKFEGRCLGCDGVCAEFEITGRIGRCMTEHGWKVGNKIKVQIPFCTFSLVSSEVDNADPS